MGYVTPTCSGVNGAAGRTAAIRSTKPLPTVRLQRITFGANRLRGSACLQNGFVEGECSLGTENGRYATARWR
jgi:hypothetical protein